MLKAKDKTATGTPPKERTLVRHALGSVGGIIAETTKVYREARDGKLEHDKARSLVWMLSQLRAMVETQALERLEHATRGIVAIVGGAEEWSHGCKSLV